MKWLARVALFATPPMSAFLAYLVFDTDLNSWVKILLTPLLGYGIYCVIVIGWKLGRLR